jgi:hypothetical protein
MNSATKTASAVASTINGVEWEVRRIAHHGHPLTSFSAMMTDAQRADAAEFLALATARGYEVKTYSSADDADMDPGTVQVCVFAKD